VWAILFGIIFGEFFGTFGERFGLHPFIDRSKTIVPLFVFAIALGALHVLLGILLGLWQSFRARQSKLLTERSGAFLSLIAVFALAGVAVEKIPHTFFTPAIIFLLIGFVLMAIPRGFLGLLLSFVELLGTVGNVLSYLRLAAIGLASVYLSMVANQLAGASGSIWLALLVATLFHSLNIALSMVSPTIQAIRLHYVEFFSKFFEPGGRPYQPFCHEPMTLNS
jgi:V/A-type H+-transporting ATPase subunit I